MRKTSSAFVLWNDVADTTDRLAEQAQVREEPDEHHRPARHPPLLRQHRPRQLDGRRTAHGGPQNRPVLQNHADSQVWLQKSHTRLSILLCDGLQEEIFDNSSGK